MSDLETVARYSSFLASLGILHLVGGSLASSAWGEQRATNDADFLLKLTPELVDPFLDALPDGYSVEPEEVRRTAASPAPFESFQVLYEPLVFKLDNFVASEPWDDARLSRAVKLELRPGAQVPFSSAEDMIIAKCRWFELGNRKSDRQWRDLLRLYEVQSGHLDEALVERLLEEFGLLELWQELKGQVGR